MEGTKKELTAFGKQVKYKLIDLGRTQIWLHEQVTAKTGMFMDSSYLNKILTGERAAPKVTQAIREILDISGVTTE